MNTRTKNYLVIKNVCSDKNLISYLEQICQEENVSILHEEFNQFDLWNNKQSVYAEFNAKPNFDMLLWSYDTSKLDYVNYLYYRELFHKELEKHWKLIYDNYNRTST